MLINPPHPMYDHSPYDVSRVARMFADWCADRAGAETRIASDLHGNILRVYATLKGRSIVAAFRGDTYRFARCGTVIDGNEARTVTSLKALADALTGRA